MKFNKAKCKVLYVGSGNLKNEFMLGDEGIERGALEKDLGRLVDKKLNMAQKSLFTAQKANRILGCIKRSITSRLREVSLPLCSCEIPLGCCIQL